MGLSDHFAKYSTCTEGVALLSIGSELRVWRPTHRAPWHSSTYSTNAGEINPSHARSELSDCELLLCECRYLSLPNHLHTSTHCAYWRAAMSYELCVVHTDPAGSLTAQAELATSSVPGAACLLRWEPGTSSTSPPSASAHTACISHGHSGCGMATSKSRADLCAVSSTSPGGPPAPAGLTETTSGLTETTSTALTPGPTSERAMRTASGCDATTPLGRGRRQKQAKRMSEPLRMGRRALWGLRRGLHAPKLKAISNVVVRTRSRALRS